MSQAKDSTSRAQDLLALFEQGARSVNQLVQEQHSLRDRLAELEGQRESAAPASTGLPQGAAEAAAARDLSQRVHELEEENRDFANRYVQVEKENAQIVNLYVASSQLHSSLELAEVLNIIVQIVINLIGAENLAIYVLDERSGNLEGVVAEGVDRSELPSFPLGSGTVGGALASGNTAFQPENAPDDPNHPIVCIPLRAQDRPIGVIAIHRLLKQKDAFTPLDHDLFSLLAEHAATALLAAQLYSQSKRKLDMFQGLCELLVN